MESVKTYIIVLILILFSLKSKSQNATIFSQYLMNQSSINPAYNGIHDMGNITINSRGQWAGIKGAPITNMVSFASTITDHSAAGFLIQNDLYGINSVTDYTISLAYRIDKLGDILSLGLQGGATSFVQDFNKIDAEVFDDPAIGSGKQTQSSSNFGFGIMYKTDVYYLGAAALRLNESEIIDEGITLSTYKPTYNISGGLLITPIDFFKIKPSFLVQYSDGKIDLDLNGQVSISEVLWLGASLRNLNVAGLNMIYTDDDIYHFGYSFQLPFNEIGTVGYGTHEIFMSFDLRLGKRHFRKARYL
jgi:type IX secretion system PorP/SprF family membrane protein